MTSEAADSPLARPAETMAACIRDRARDSSARTFLYFEDQRWTFAEAYRASCRYANLFLKQHDGASPFHVGVLMENLPAFAFAELGVALAGGTLVGLNPTRTGSALARDVSYADCEIVLVEDRLTGQLREALDAGATRPRVFVVEGGEGGEAASAGAGVPGEWLRLEAALEGVSAEDPGVEVDPSQLLLILFTSGTTKAPKGVLNSNRRLMTVGWSAAAMMCEFTPSDVVYCAMPLFHANAQVLAFVPALSAGGGLALARRFRKTRFLSDVRRYGATLFNYVGNPLAYIMDTPELPDDSDNPLRLACGNEAPRQYIDAFAKRFGCRVRDGYGASEVGVGFVREPGDPPRSLGRAEGVKILNEQDEECATAVFDDAGRLRNPDEAVGEIVNTAGTMLFEGYYKDEAATQARTRKGWFRTGDMGYRDAEGFIYFAGRDAEWLRVGGENFLARPIEELLCRDPDITLASIYGVPDPEAGDQVMATIKMREGRGFDPVVFSRRIDEMRDLPPRWRPTFVRIAERLTETHTNKVLKRQLRREKFLLDRVRDPIYWRPRGAKSFRRFTEDDLSELRGRFERAGHADRLEE